MRHDPCPQPAVGVVRHDQCSLAICKDDEDVWHKSCPSASGPWCDWWPTGAAIVSLQLSCIIQTDRSTSGVADVTTAFLSNKDCVYEWILWISSRVGGFFGNTFDSFTEEVVTNVKSTHNEKDSGSPLWCPECSGLEPRNWRRHYIICLFRFVSLRFPHEGHGVVARARGSSGPWVWFLTITKIISVRGECC